MIQINDNKTIQKYFVRKMWNKLNSNYRLPIKYTKYIGTTGFSTIKSHSYRGFKNVFLHEP